MTNRSNDECRIAPRYAANENQWRHWPTSVYISIKLAHNAADFFIILLLQCYRTGEIDRNKNKKMKIKQ